MKTPNPGLKPMAPGLRTVHYDAQSAAKVDLIVRPGDVLIVSGDVAEQLAANSSQFKDVTPEDDNSSTHAFTNEVAAILRRGEVVLTPGQAAATANAGGKPQAASHTSNATVEPTEVAEAAADTATPPAKRASRKRAPAQSKK